jgi:hypothetical protein
MGISGNQKPWWCSDPNSPSQKQHVAVQVQGHKPGLACARLCARFAMEVSILRGQK